MPRPLVVPPVVHVSRPPSSLSIHWSSPSQVSTRLVWTGEGSRETGGGFPYTVESRRRTGRCTNSPHSELGTQRKLCGRDTTPVDSGRVSTRSAPRTLSPRVVVLPLYSVPWFHPTNFPEPRLSSLEPNTPQSSFLLERRIVPAREPTTPLIPSSFSTCWVRHSPTRLPLARTPGTDP